jgi:hypothetical protein
VTHARRADREAAERRVQAFLDDLDRLDIDALVQTALPASGPDVTAARHEAERLAREAGLEDVLADARATVRTTLIRRYDAGMYRPTMVGLQWGISEGSVDDRVRTVEAALDAVTAAVIEPLAPAGLVEQLASPFELIDRGGELDASLPLSEATARALRPGVAADGASRIVLTVAVVVVAGLLLFVGVWPLALAWIVVVGLGVIIARRGRPDA